MKTTLDIGEPLLRAAKAAARKCNITLAVLIERGLTLALAEPEPPRPFRLRDASIGGQSLRFQAAGHTWSEL